MGSIVFIVMVARAQMEPGIKCERIIDSVAKCRAADKYLGGWGPMFADFQIRIVLRLIGTGEPAAQVARDLGMSWTTCTGGSVGRSRLTSWAGALAQVWETGSPSQHGVLGGSGVLMMEVRGLRVPRNGACQAMGGVGADPAVSGACDV
jgi:hypothetical protein